VVYRRAYGLLELAKLLRSGVQGIGNALPATSQTSKVARSVFDARLYLVLEDMHQMALLWRMGTKEPTALIWEITTLTPRRRSMLSKSMTRKSNTPEQRDVDSPQVVGLLETTLGDPIRTGEKCGHGHV